MYINPITLTDSYKISHKNMTVPGVTQIYSNLTPRFTKYLEEQYPDFDGGIVWFGIQGVIKQIFFEYFQEGFFNRNKDEVIQEALDILGPYIGVEDLSHFEALHDLGYLPLEIRALPEGSIVTAGVPCFTIKNTHPDYQWLPNYLESILSTQLWKMFTVATISRIFNTISNENAIETTGSTAGVEFQNHDFSLRGQSGLESASAVGAAFLLFSQGTDNIPALSYIQNYYNTDLKESPVAFSVPAGEHSVCTLGIQKFIKDLKDKDPYYADI